METVCGKQMREIRSLAPVKCWYHHACNVNPVDLPSRGTDFSLLSIPPGVCEPDQKFSEFYLCVLPEACAMELKTENRSVSQGAHNLMVQELCQFDSVIRCEGVSTLRWLPRVTAYVQKFIALLKSVVRGNSQQVTNTLTVSDIANTEQLWIKLSQNEQLKNSKFEVWQWQFGLNSDIDGAWRCRGRLSNADLPEEMKHPIILDKGHHLAVLVFRIAIPE